MARTALGTRQLENVVGVRAGQQNGSIVVVSHRDALASPARAQLSGTAAMLQLASVLNGETLQHTVILASTSGSDGAAGAAALARSLPQPVDAVIALGDMGGTDLREPDRRALVEQQQVAPPRASQHRGLGPGRPDRPRARLERPARRNSRTWRFPWRRPTSRPSPPPASRRSSSRSPASRLPAPDEPVTRSS